MSIPRIPILIVALFFIGGGIAHFVVADFFVAIMPDYLQHHWELVIISGVFELIGAVGILIPRTRMIAGYGLIALCVAVFPANLNMALHPDQFADVPRLFLYSRLPLQLVIIGFIWWSIKPERLQGSHVYP